MNNEYHSRFAWNLHSSLHILARYEAIYFLVVTIFEYYIAFILLFDVYNPTEVHIVSLSSS
jgi:hypothetical protein